MFWLIENQDQIEKFQIKGYNKAFVEVIPYSKLIHPVLNKVSLIYIKPLNNSKGYIISIDHPESFQIEEEIIQNLLSKIETIYVRDKKEFLHYFYHKKCYQVTQETPQDQPESHKFIYKKYPKRKDQNQIIPISKHYEYLENIFNSIIIPDKPNLFKDNKTSIVFNIIEKSGIKINNKLYNQYFDYPFKDFAYTKYNLDTTTTRPSNAFGGINFSSLNKENGEREVFIPRNDYFLDLDISAYHPTLISKVIGYKFDDGKDIHQAFSEMYKVDYNTSKEITFKQMYGGIFEKYKTLPYFSELQKFIDKLWEEFNTKGYIECPISKNRFYKSSLPTMNPQKLLSYFLQSLETSNNVVILYEILKILHRKNTRLVLYVYDSFLFDVDKNEKEVLREIKKVFDKHKLKVKSKKGLNYNFK